MVLYRSSSGQSVVLEQVCEPVLNHGMLVLRQAKAAAVLARGGVLTATREHGVDSDQARQAAAVMVQCNWRARQARKEFASQKSASKLIQVRRRGTGEVSRQCG